MDYAELEQKALMLTPSGVKARLPITYVLEKNGHPVEEIDDDGRLHTCCPFHDDHSPSLDVFGGRWGCWPCGKGGDVLDLLKGLWEDCMGETPTFSELMMWARQLADEVPPDWAEKQGAEYIHRPWDPRKALARVEESQVDDFVLRSIAEHYGWPDPQWLVERWRLGSEWNQVLIPYYRRDGSLCTYKRRGIGTHTLAAAGGELCLYGEWLDTDLDKTVILCEGESDTWTIDRALGSTHACLGVPGAGWFPHKKEDLAPFEGREVILTFDADEAGHKGMKRWAERLSAVGANPTTWALPDGQDIRSYLR